jgi:hypothetical protein
MTRPARVFEASYVLPIRGPDDVANGELTDYLGWLGRQVDLIVVDGSDPAVADRRAARWAGLPLRHTRLDPHHNGLNGKVAGVITGVHLANTDRIVIADEDVRYDAATLERVIRLLDGADLVRPQNYFDPCPWHARWDTARTLLNRIAGGDYPGTLAVRRSAFGDGYDGDVLFENLELMRTVADFAQPVRLVGSLLVIPLTAMAALRRRWPVLLGVAASSVLAAEAGRVRAGGRRVFTPTAPLFAPLWVLERGVCSWLALFDRVVHGGVRYRNVVIRRAASSPRRLMEQHRATLASTVHVDPVEGPGGRTFDDRSGRGEARSVAGAVPGRLGVIPLERAPEVRATDRDGVDGPARGAVRPDGVTPDLDDSALAGAQ